MRIAELSLRYPPAHGGVEATLGQLVERLRTAGEEVTVLTSDLERVRPFARRPTLDPPDGAGVRRFRAVRAAPFPLGLGVAVPGMFLAASSGTFDLVHAHAFGYFPTWAGAAVRRMRGTPLVITTHSDPGRGLAFSSLYHRAVARATLRAADRIVAQSEVERRFLVGLGLDSGRIVVLPTGIGLDEFTARTSPPATGVVRLLYVGRLDFEQKGLDLLLDAMARLPRDPPVSLRVVGDDWGALAPMRAFATRPGLAGRVEFAPSASRVQVLEAYRTADVFVLPSRFESFPRALLEAMAAGLPVVATRVGGVPEIVDEGRNALLVAPGDAEDLATALATICSDGPMRERFGPESRRRAAKYDWERLVPRYRALFDEAVRTG